MGGHGRSCRQWHRTEVATVSEVQIRMAQFAKVQTPGSDSSCINFTVVASYLVWILQTKISTKEKRGDDTQSIAPDKCLKLPYPPFLGKKLTFNVFLLNM